MSMEQLVELEGNVEVLGEKLPQCYFAITKAT
jgi:hypothetical protein